MKLPTHTTLCPRDITHRSVNIFSTELLVTAQEVVFALAHNISFLFGEMCVGWDKCKIVSRFVSPTPPLDFPGTER